MLKVLIVDDDIATVEVIRDTVRWQMVGVEEVRTAYNAAEARKILEEEGIDIVISDIEMPQESGIDLLRWVRLNNIRCEFLLLTCHEEFTYAASALNHEAAAYLTKPFEIDIMEMNLQKAAAKILAGRSLEESSRYGEWMKSNLRAIRLDFWKQLMSGELVSDREWLLKEIGRRHLGIEADQKRLFVYTKVSNAEGDLERFGKNLFDFILEGFQSEIISQKVVNETVVKTGSGEETGFITICKAIDRDEVRKRCEQFIEIGKEYFKASITCCISSSYNLEEMEEAKQRIEELFNYNINQFGNVFYEEEAQRPDKRRLQILDLEQLTEQVANKDKAGVLRYIRTVFRDLEAYKELNIYSLYLMKQELIQVVYADLAKHGIQATRLFYDELSIKFAQKASKSMIDMVRWINFMLDKTFDYEEQIQKSYTLIDKVNDYIHAHYMEEISRNEIAGEFYLTPEYLAKTYKKKSGINLKDYINKYRVERAKEQLKDGEKSVSDVAEAVGFDNYSYFSTVFKKYVGMTPKEYRMS